MASWQESDDKPRQGVEKQRRYSANQVRIVKAIVFPMVKNGCESWTIKKAVQLLSCVRLFVTPWIAACQASLCIINSWSLLKFMSIKSVMPSNHLILCHPLLLLPSIFPSIRERCSSSPMNRLFASDGQSTATSASASVLLLVVQGTLRSLLQHHSSKASILLRSVFFMV